MYYIDGVLTGELATIANALTSISAKPAWSHADAELTTTVETLYVLEQRLAGVKLALLGEFDDRGLARDLGTTSTAAWAHWRLRCSPTTASAMVRLSRALRDRPTTAAALAAGQLTVDQARAITDSLAALPPDLDAARPAVTIIDQVEDLLLEHAHALDPTRLRVAGRHALATIAPDLADAMERAALEASERRAHRHRYLDLHDDDHGGTIIRGYLNTEGASLLRTALDPLTRPLGVGDERTAGQRRADALAEICDKVMRDGALPTQGGQPTQLVVTANYDVLARALGVGQADTGERLSPTTVRRLACDALVIPAVMGGEGQVLDLGRGRRLFTGAIRRALNLRDGGCAFPGCTRAATWCDAHHRISWLDGGPTSLENGVLVCRYHHTLLHEPGGWSIHVAHDGLPVFIPPPWIDPERRPLRNTRHALSRPP